jgi:hypothetical protein
MRARTLHFPDDCEVGQLTVYQEAKLLFHRPAAGRVDVPEGGYVLLSVYAPVRGMGGIAPDDIQEIHTPKKTTTDADLAALSHLTGIEVLHSAKATLVTDRGLVSVARLKKLRHLDLHSSKVTDKGLAHLRGLKQLESLQLGSTHVKGPGLSALRGLTQLRRLSLEETEVDDKALPHLMGLPSLRHVALAGSRVSLSGLARLRAHLESAQHGGADRRRVRSAAL